jgi:putative ABC transport system permease protein
MQLWFKLGWRNLLKNKRRSLVTMAAVALGFVAINLVIGFMLYVLRGLEDSYVYTFEGGHLEISKITNQNEADLPDHYIFSEEEVTTLSSLCTELPFVELASPRLALTGMLSNGSVSSIMFAEGKVSADSLAIRRQGRGFVSNIEMFDGQDLDQTGAYDIGISKGLAQKLDLQIGSDVITMAATTEGYMNALDAHIVQLQDAPLEILDKMLVTLPYAYAQELLDTQGADKVIILLKHGTTLEAAQLQIVDMLKSHGFSVNVTNWKDLRVSYHRIRSMFNVLFGFILMIVLLIVALSVINTVSMAAIERTREIGTLRALGLKRKGVIALFSCESILLGICGSLAGFIIYFVCWQSIHSIRPTWIPPNIPKRVPWEIAWSPETLLLSSVGIVSLTVIASVLPARSASRMEVAEALTHT